MSMDTSKKEFLVLQFQAIRAEILALKSRVIYLQGISLSGIPLILGAGEKFDIDLVLGASPIITVCAALMLLFEQSSIMRAGRFMRDYVEPQLAGEGAWTWECYLEAFPENRRAEKLFAASSYIAFVVYYLLGTYLAHRCVVERFGSEWGAPIVAFYGGGLIPAIIGVILLFRTSSHFGYGPQRRPSSGIPPFGVEH